MGLFIVVTCYRIGTPIVVRGNEKTPLFALRDGVTGLKWEGNGKTKNLLMFISA